MTEAITAPTKRLLAAIKDGTHGTFSRLSEGGHVFLSAKNVLNGKLRIESDESRISQQDFQSITSNGFPRANDVLLTIVGTIGRTCVFSLPETLAFQRSVAFLRPNEKTDPRYLSYLLQSALFQEQLELATKSAAQGGVYMGDVWNATCTFIAGRTDQERIANFLDDKTARIDALIAEKERLVVSVREYEQGEISRVLTQGLGTVDLMPTGRPFITAAPRHWRVTSFKRALLGLGQGWSPQCESRPAEAHEWGVLKVGCVNGTSFDANENKALPPPLEPDLTCVLRRGDVLVSRANTRELVGLAALVEEAHPNLLICDKLYRLQLRSDWVTAEFTVLLLRSDVSRRQIELGASGASSSMQNISQDVIRELLVAFPPLNEQREIVTKAMQVRESCNLLVGHCEEHIARLREYRSSLISAAVTGQLDLDSPEVPA